jgi:large subunit ribosomal protein L6
MFDKTLRRLQGVSLFRFKGFVVFLSVKGRFVFDVTKSSKLIISPSLFNDVMISEPKNLFSSSVSGLKTFYVKKLILVGIGFRCWSYFDQIKNCQVLVIKLGLSKDVLIFLPSEVLVFCFWPTLIVIMGFSKEIVSLVVAQIRSIKVSDPYKGKGVRCEGELVALKPGKQR